MNHDQAHSYCHEIGMDLFTVRSVDQNHALKKIVSSSWSHGHSYWINGKNSNNLWYMYHSLHDFSKKLKYMGFHFHNKGEPGQCLRFAKINGVFGGQGVSCEELHPVLCEFGDKL
ncbi:hypothetical protein PVAND_015847 [Polypedilum vanderplanki]|uniref:C-type lectin domain-containing protein n=1 Tax=Polypedilum vanderplanki TaxID=319348 RepID=A0A9J6BDC0_POLVA|nr:hypothetical protein PVAND_015847 [Polypedilum vanderplanki]